MSSVAPATTSVHSHDSPDPDVTAPAPVETTSCKVRNLTAFWLFGLLNNYAYVVMLSAAYDILDTGDSAMWLGEGQPAAAALGDNITSTTMEPGPLNRTCNPTSTSAVLLCDVLPSFLIKCTAPLFVHHFPFGVRVAFVIVMQAISFLVVALARVTWLSLLGVVFASIGSGLGEITFLAMGAHFDGLGIIKVFVWIRNGMSGVAGSILYALLAAAVGPRNTLFIQLVVPVAFVATYWGLTVFPATVNRAHPVRPGTWYISEFEYVALPGSDQESDERWLVERPAEDDDEDEVDVPGPAFAATNKAPLLTITQRLALVVPLLRFMIPLCLVYFAEYFINQGLQELVQFYDLPNFSLSAQYRWYQVLYQIGVFISRSSVNILHITGLWLFLLPVLQFINLSVFLTDAIYFYIPSIYIVFVLILYEGLLGGAAYVNTFYQIRKEISPAYVEYSLGVASVGDSLGIVLAAFTSLPVHNWICGMPRPAPH